MIVDGNSKEKPKTPQTFASYYQLIYRKPQSCRVSMKIQSRVNHDLLFNIFICFSSSPTDPLSAQKVENL